MPASDTDIVLPQGKHPLEARGAAPKGLAELKKFDFSLHHILPYRYPLFIGFLVENYRDRLRTGSREGWPESDLTDPIARMVNEFLEGACVFRSRQPTRSLATQFAWMSPNLFQGPAGNLRTDDPHSERETIKPASMDEGLWNALAEVEAMVRRLATVESESGYTASLNKDITVLDLKMLLRTLGYFTRRGHSNALKFAPTDWIVMWALDPPYKIESPIEDRFKARFAAYEARTRSDPKGKITRFTPKLETMDLQSLGLWRLRLPGEAVPLLVFQTNRLQP